ncbi:MAG: class II fructose-bisphosphatase, partial [Chloroflexi bacterium]|nr:class II fructose-bisphosphatase [Chloroflexota bacterium]
VIGEGEKDEAPMLYIGETVGNGLPPQVDVAVDPIDGTRLLSRGLPNALSVVAIAERGSMHCPRQVVYVDKIAVGPVASKAIDITASVEWNLKAIAKAKGCSVHDLTVVVLDRPRHEGLVEEIRRVGARIKLIYDGDVAGGVMAAMEDTGVDCLMGVGGTPEGVLTAAALKCLGGEIQCRPWPRNEGEREALIRAGIDPQRVYTTDELVEGDDIFFAATGVTDGELLQGVRYFSNGARTSSLVMRSRSGSVRYISARHNFERLSKISSLPFSHPDQP